VAYNFQIGSNKIKLLPEYENVTQRDLFGNAVLAALISGRKYDVIPQNGVRVANGQAWFVVVFNTVKRSGYCLQLLL
jgi:hypothetical protein